MNTPQAGRAMDDGFISLLTGQAPGRCGNAGRRRTAVQVTKAGGFAAFESYDGKTLYYAKGPNSAGLWSAPVRGGKETLVLKQLAVGSWGYWALTRDGIYFYDAATNAIEILQLCYKRSSSVVTPDKTPAYRSPGLSVSPDSHWILYTQIDSSAGNIMLVENFHW